MVGEYLALEKTIKSMTKIIGKYIERALFCRDYITTDSMRITHYCDMLRT